MERIAFDHNFIRKLSLSILAVIVAVAMIVSVAPQKVYADDRVESDVLTTVSSEGFVTNVIGSNKAVWVKIGVSINDPGGALPTGSATLTLQKQISEESWSQLGSTRNFSFVENVGNTGWISLDDITGTVGRYRIQAVYTGDVNYQPGASVGWHTFSIVQWGGGDDGTGTPTPGGVTTPGGTTDPGTIPDNATKVTPTPQSTGGNVANGGKIRVTKTPTGRFAIDPVKGAPTGKVKFTLQKKVGKKWKSAGTQSKKFDGKSAKVTAKFAKANNVATYRWKAEYPGDTHYNAAATSWNTFKVSAVKASLKKAAKVYAKASTKSKKLATFKKGKKVSIIGIEKSYYKVSYKKGGGFISKKYVKAV